jgi:hypothetical protein
VYIIDLRIGTGKPYLRTFLVNAEDWLGGDGGGEGRGHQLQALVAAQNHWHLQQHNI